MKAVKAKDLRNLSQGELLEKRRGFEKNLFDLRQKQVTGQLDKPAEFKKSRRQVARINTLLREAENARK